MSSLRPAPVRPTVKLRLLAALGGLTVLARVAALGPFAAAPIVAAPLLATGCGGCPWTSSSDATLAPATECLEIEVSDGDRHLETGEGGCVDPILFGTNTCAEPVTFVAASFGVEADIVVAPGEEFEFVISLNEGEHEGEAYSFELDALRGDTSFTVSFRTFEPWS
ncbi:hypothetical protein [Nannocystis radixulma]|uniref:Lipoprotein n=1 Tax=Nannocystis radixulma TaxID=2995305 RepID=A0ABT5BLD8_9BACT|nr:hypothetical protein [Nannocystis radixulma]MDC0674339.1 hypothetical protein [Nannocystis radixulma]